MRTMRTMKKLTTYKRLRSTVSKNKGAGLIEILIALTVLAVGLLGVLSLQARGLNSGQRAVFTTEASMLAEDMAERILAFGITGANGAQFTDTNTATAAPPQGCLVACNPAQQETNSENDWASLVNGSSLPSAIGNVSVNGALYTISIRWDDERTGLAAVSIDNDCIDDATSNARDTAGNLVSLSCFQMQVSVQ